MSLSSTFRSEADKLSGDAQTITLKEDERQLVCEILRCDSVGCEFMQLRVHSDRLQGLPLDELRAISQQLSERVTYLLEPIGPIESDQFQCVVQMRSLPPGKEENATRYYELLVQQAGDLVLCRYERRVGEERRSIPAQVTREVLQRLVEDFEAVLP